MRKTLTILATAMFVMALGSTALAGGMAITSFDSLPGEFEAGETYKLDYTILQHGVTPIDVGSSSLVFTSGDTGESVIFQAEESGPIGRYTVEVTLPDAGSWHWEVTQGPFQPHDLGVVDVTPAAPALDVAPQPIDLLRVVLPIAALIAAIYTAIELARSRAASREVSAESG